MNWLIRKKSCLLEDLSRVWYYTIPLCKNSESFSLEMIYLPQNDVVQEENASFLALQINMVR